MGNTINNSLPSVPGSEIAYWKITGKIIILNSKNLAVKDALQIKKIEISL